MSERQTNNKRIAKNTLILYVRLIVSVLVGLYTVRAILRILGLEDYGIYNIVAGTVTSLSFISNTTVTAVQRFLSFSLGKNDYTSYAKYFKSSLVIFFAISFLCLFLAETIGLWFVYTKLVIPINRLNAALWVYQSCIVSLMTSFISIPYNAIIISHERMNTYAYITITDIVLKLIIVLILPLINYDKLICYSLLLMAVSIFDLFLYRYYSRKIAPQIKSGIKYDKQYTKNILGFTSWNLFGSISGLARGQGLNILINLFFGPILNTARGIAYQIYGVINSFCGNFMMAVNPQIIKLYAKNETEEWMNLVIRSSKVSFGLLLIISFPIFIIMPEILDIWLDDYPPITILFTRLIFVNMLIESISQPLLTLAQATGNVKYYQLIVGGTLILNIPLSYIAFSFFERPELCFYIMIGFNIIALYLRLIVLKSTAKLIVKAFITGSIIKCLGMFSLLSIFAYWFIPVQNLFDYLLLILTSLMIPVLEFFILFNNIERKRIIGIIKHKFRR